MYLGIDGCRAGWLLASIDADNNLSHQLLRNLIGVESRTSKLILIDMPVGFPEHEFRQCDMQAKRLLGHGRQATVFFTPHRKAVYAGTFVEANKVNRQYTGKGVSMQAWNICGKIREVNDFVLQHPHFPLRESHPELCFYSLNGNKPFISRKTTTKGIADRRALIEARSQNYLKVIDQTLSRTKRKDVKIDDVLDATILAIRASSPDLRRLPAICTCNDKAFITF